MIKHPAVCLSTHPLIYYGGWGGGVQSIESGRLDWVLHRGLGPLTSDPAIKVKGAETGSFLGQRMKSIT